MKHCINIRINVLREMYTKVANTDFKPHPWEESKNFSFCQILIARMPNLDAEASKCRHLVGLEPLPKEE